MLNRLKSITKSPYFIITAVYLLAHFFLLVLSGCWWDDWTFMSHNLNYVNLVASGSGRPEWNILIPLCWSLTNNGRILIFFLYLFDSYFVYNILKDSKLFSIKDSLLITLLFIIIPVNDARLLISNFPYAVGLFFFFLAFMLFIKWNNSNRKVLPRVLILLLFLISFILNSLLAFYYVLFIYLFIIDIKDNKENNIIKRVLISIKNVIVKYTDFFILPFVYFGLNKLLFPVTSTDFEGRSSISIMGLIKCIKYLPLSIINVFKEIYANYFKVLTFIPLLICLVVFIVIFIIKNKTNNKPDTKKWLIYLLVGFVVLALGLFVYVEVRSSVIYSNGVKGRDTILVPLGMSIIIYSTYSLFNEKYKQLLCILTIILGIFSFNSLYIEWQEDYYQQLSMESLMNNSIIKNNDTFFLANLDESDIEGERYYSLNTNAYHVFNDETRLFIPKVSNLYLLESKENVDMAVKDLDYCHMMKDYNPEDYNLDAIIIYSCDYDANEVLRLKTYELFNKDIFNEIIKNTGDMKTVEVDDDFTSLLISKYNSKEVNDDKDVVNLLMAYNK